MNNTAILALLYVSTAGTSWINNLNWKSGDPCTDNWFGVTCFSSNNIKIDLNSNNLIGTLPSQIGLITNQVHSLILHTNSLTGSIPSELGMMTGLYNRLTMYNTQFSGAIPSQMGKLVGLTGFFQFFGTKLTGTIPSQLGSLSLLSELNLFFNSISGSIPSQLGQMESVSSLFWLSSNTLCDEIPSEVSALSSQVGVWDIVSGNNLGTACPSPTSSPTLLTDPPTLVPSSPTLIPTPSPSASPIPLPSMLPTLTPTLVPSLVPTVLPTNKPTPLPSFGPSPLPTVRPSPFPTSSPTPVPTVHCELGTYLSNGECISCPAGSYDRNGTGVAPFPTECFDCPVGQYSATAGSVTCLACSGGKLSSSDRTSCDNCEAGEYSYQDVACVECENGKYAPVPQAESCLTCNAGFYTAVVNESGTFFSTTGATSCLSCASGYYSNEASSSCELAFDGYYLAPPNQQDSFTCPKNALCDGRYQVPVPDVGYWVDRSSYGFVGSIHKCSRNTCVGGNKSDECWSLYAYNLSNYFENTSDYARLKTKCNADHLLCSEGSYGPICGSCKEGYIYQFEAKGCKPCASSGSNLNTKNLVIGIIVLAVLLFVFVTSSFRTYLRLLWTFITSFDGGSLKVLWVTYQILMSVSWNLDVKFPNPFDQMLGSMTIFSLDFLTLECLQHGNASTRYFDLVYMWSSIPIVFLVIIMLTCFCRLAYSFLRQQQASTYYADEDDEDDEDDDDDETTEPKNGNLVHHSYHKRKRSQIVNQHFSMALLLTYLVLPAVANKQLQSLDCISFSKEGISFLRIDSKINCYSSEYKTFRSVLFVFIIVYQSIPILWMFLLFLNRNSLDRNMPSHNEKLELYIRDNNKSLNFIRFLFNDYKVKKWWFEVVEMYRRIVFIGVLPLTSTVTAKRASFGCFLAIVSLAYFREQSPYRMEFVNQIAYLAQFLILITFYAALSIDTGVLMDFGMSGRSLGIFLMSANLLTVFLVIYIGLSRFHAQKLQEDQIRQKAEKMEWALTFSSEKFRTTFAALTERSVPVSDILLFHYTSHDLARMAMRSGIAASKKFDGVPFTLRPPFQTGSAERYVFGGGPVDGSGRMEVVGSNSESTHADKTDVNKNDTKFPNDVLLVLSLPRLLLRPLKGFEHENYLCSLPLRVLKAMRSSHPSNVVDIKPWVDRVALIPPTCILRSYVLLEQSSSSTTTRNSSVSSTALLKHRKSSFERLTSKSVSDKNGLETDTWAYDVPIATQFNKSKGVAGGRKRGEVITVKYLEQYLHRMKEVREEAKQANLVPLYHYTSPSVLRLIIKHGLRMSGQGQGDGGVYFSTKGPCSYALGTPEYEANIIRDCFGVERVDEYLGKGKLDGVIVYGCEADVLVQAPGGRDNAKMIPRSTFDDLMLPHDDGNYFLRPDRILSIFIMKIDNFGGEEETTSSFEEEQQRHIHEPEYQSEISQEASSATKLNHTFAKFNEYAKEVGELAWKYRTGMTASTTSSSRHSSNVIHGDDVEQPTEFVDAEGDVYDQEDKLYKAPISQSEYLSGANDFNSFPTSASTSELEMSGGTTL